MNHNVDSSYRFTMCRLSLVAVMALACLAGPRPAGAADAGVAYAVDFKGYTGGSVLEWLGRKKFVAKQDTDNKRKTVLSIHDEALVLEAKQRALGLLLNETDVPGPGRIRIEWGVDAFPLGVSYEKGIRSEPIMVYTFFGKKKVSSGSLLVPDSPYFIGLFLCDAGRTTILTPGASSRRAAAMSASTSPRSVRGSSRSSTSALRSRTTSS
jgi:hypothetical protein